MLGVVTSMHGTMQEVEEMMLAGYKGREKEARMSCQALSEEKETQKE